GGVAAAKVHVRGNGFPDPGATQTNGDLRSRLGIPAEAPLVLYVGRIAAGKGIEHLLAAMRELPAAHLVLAGPDDRHGIATDADRGQPLPLKEEPPRQ